ncbi:MAG: hypothetical protein EZS28_042609 [Streblomastix strix]|uniref:Uncharacterized protein n=1 Tax=Streblomastix strix TaxID=222440 RepID=A0A5J4TWU1_9EUKA|nr:MAG: hypothetical protein EZS28_042609 [Streblomastix strix]
MRRKFEIKENSKVIVDEDSNRDQNKDDNKENLFPDGVKEDETDVLINKMIAAENKGDQQRRFKKKEKQIMKKKINMNMKKNWKRNFDSEYGNDIWGDFDEDGQDEPDQQTGKEGAETEEEENQLLIKIRIQKKKQSCS